MYMYMYVYIYIYIYIYTGHSFAWCVLVHGALVSAGSAAVLESLYCIIRQHRLLLYNKTITRHQKHNNRYICLILYNKTLVGQQLWSSYHYDDDYYYYVICICICMCICMIICSSRRPEL